MMASLLRRDKKSTAAHLKAELNRPDNSAGLRQLQELLDCLLNLERPAGDSEALEWCRCLLAGGDGFEEFCKTVRSYDNATLCGLVWTANFVAYRCRTCGISPCMSLCAECFNNGDHTGHDFNMFRSQAGGACDCGDSNVMRESGFCKRHRSKTGANVPLVPKELLTMSEMILPRFIISIIQYLRDGYMEPDPLSDRDLQKVLQQLEPQISFLEELTKMGGAMRTVLTKVLTNQQTYSELSVGATANEDQLESSKEEDQDGSRVGKRKRVKLSGSTKDLTIMGVLKHKCFLEELLFWTIKYEFPQKMVTFLLNMLPDQEYKIAFTKTFVQHYAFIMKTLMKSHESDTMSNRIVHISVQLFSNEELARHVTEECRLLEIMVTVLLYMMEGCLIKSDIQGMNLNKRELNEHVEFESQTYYAAFAAELEACAQPMWGLLTHCKVKETQEYTKTMLRFCLEALQMWFDAISFVDEAVKCQGLDLDSLLPDQEVLMKIMVHPLQIQASLSEIHSNMWVRNGLQIKGQAMTYVQSHFCNSMIDPDIYLLQVCASRLDPDYFISSVFERFKVVDLLTMASQHQNSLLDTEHERPMLEGALTFLVILLSLRIHLAEVWEREFDPIMVILRTVYRRDVQSAMDRYTAFLKQSGKFSGSPWPPYKERTPLHTCYRGLTRLLHCKTLHIVLFTLLYKISMDHVNMSEHILCMVLYLIELGLDNAPQDELEEEEPNIDENCHDSWFPGTNLISNLHHVINYVRVRVPETAPEVKKETPASTSTDASTFAQNSGTAQIFSLVAERRRKFQEIINRSSGEANQAVRPKSSSTKWNPLSSTPQLTTVILEVRESILSLLIKLHHKLSAKQNSFYPPWLESLEAFGRLDLAKYAHGDGITAIERILTKAAFRSRQNKRSIQEICRKISPPVPPKKTSPADKKVMDKEERRQKARERQQKLLAEFASRQKSFMETAMDVESPEADIAMDLGSSEQQNAEILYDCVICGQSGPSTEDRPAGLVVLLQASSVLGHRCKSSEPKKLPTSDEEHIYPEDTCGAASDVRLTMLQRFFKDNDQVLQGFSVDKGEFTCPLCRQFANSVLPCHPGKGVARVPWQGQNNKSLVTLVKEVEEFQEQPGSYPKHSKLTKVMYLIGIASEISLVLEHKSHFIINKTNLELELVHRGGDLCCGGASAAAKRSCMSSQSQFHCFCSTPLEQVLYTTFLNSDSQIDMRRSEDERPEVPILFRDVPSLLLIFVLTMPQPLHKEHFTCIVKVLYTVQYIQAIASLSVKFSAEERIAWETSGALKKLASSSEKSWEVLLSHVISELWKCKCFYEVANNETSVISSCIWSPQSIEYALQQYCLPFLRITSLLQHHLFGDDLPSCLPEDEFSVLANCLGLLPSNLQLSNQLNSAYCLEWSVSAFEIISQWCSEVRAFSEANAEHAVHSQHCGAATGIFLLINASVIIIIRGYRFCLWGSVYLDAHGEEDRDLREHSDGGTQISELNDSLKEILKADDPANSISGLVYCYYTGNNFTIYLLYICKSPSMRTSAVHPGMLSINFWAQSTDGSPFLQNQCLEFVRIGGVFFVLPPLEDSSRAMNKELEQNILRKQLLPTIQEEFGDQQCLFQYDGAPGHKAKVRTK
ncbi:UBR3 ligase, partial [Polypterus senegalus]